MKMKKLFQFFAVLLCIGMSTSAFAKGYYQKMSGVDSPYQTFAPIPELCETVVNANLKSSRNTGYFTGEYAFDVQGQNPISCVTIINGANPNRTWYFGFSAPCRARGYWSSDRPNGCYKWIDAEVPSDCTPYLSNGYPVCGDEPIANKCPPAGTLVGGVMAEDFGQSPTGSGLCHNECALDVPTQPQCTVLDDGSVEIFSEIGSNLQMTYTGEECR